MKTITGSIETSIKKQKLKELLKDTPETIATDSTRKSGTTTIFSVLDLWRMQKKHKTLGSSTRW